MTDSLSLEEEETLRELAGERPTILFVYPRLCAARAGGCVSSSHVHPTPNTQASRQEWEQWVNQGSDPKRVHRRPFAQISEHAWSTEAH